MKNDNENVVVGRNAIRELLKSESGIDKIFVTPGNKHGGIGEIIALAREKGVAVSQISKSRLEELSGDIPHQGICAFVPAVEYASVSDILSAAQERDEKPFIVIADEITDPHNLGAIIRSAHCAGAHGVIIPKHRSVGLNAAVLKASAGAATYTPVAKVTNIASTIDLLKEKGLWVFGADMGGEPYYKTDLTGAVAIVLGNEGKGMTRLVKEKCDAIVSIPMYGDIDSLNVSCACSVLVCEAARQRRN